MRVLISLLAAFLVLAPAEPTGRADDTPAVLVIVHPDRDVTSLDRKFIANAFLKKKTRWSDGDAIRPVDLDAGAKVRRRFSEDVLKRSVAAVRRYWNQLVFSGRGTPPPELDSEEDVVEYVLSHEGAIGYVSDGVDLKGARVVRVR